MKIVNPRKKQRGVFVDKSGRRRVKSKSSEAYLEMVWQPVYARASKGTTAAETIQFFSNIAATNRLISNLNTNSVLPDPTTHDVFGISMVPAFGTPNADLVELYNEGLVEFLVSEKKYLTTPAHKIPAGAGLTGLASNAVTSNIFSAQNGSTKPGDHYPVSVYGLPIHIKSSQEFGVSLQTFGSSAFSAAFNIWLYLEGIMGRAVQ